MALESDQERINGGLHYDSKITFIDEATTLTRNQLVCEADTTDGAMAVTLPNVEEAAGKIVSISLITDGGDLTIQDQDESRDWSDLTLDTANDFALLYSDGRKWFKLDSEHA